MKCQKHEAYDLEERLISFAVRALKVSQSLPKTVEGIHFSKQLLRSGTSPAAQYAEAQGAESREDFIHKLKIGLKELRETRVWLLILKKTSLIKNPEKLDDLLDESNQLISIFVKSIETTKKNILKTS